MLFIFSLYTGENWGSQRLKSLLEVMELPFTCTIYCEVREGSLSIGHNGKTQGKQLLYCDNNINILVLTL